MVHRSGLYSVKCKKSLGVYALFLREKSTSYVSLIYCDSTE